MELRFSFSLEMTNAIIAQLAEGPYKTVAPILAEFQRQAEPQTKVAPPVPSS